MAFGAAVKAFRSLELPCRWRRRRYSREWLVQSLSVWVSLSVQASDFYADVLVTSITDAPVDEEKRIFLMRRPISQRDRFAVYLVTLFTSTAQKT